MRDNWLARLMGSLRIMCGFPHFLDIVEMISFNAWTKRAEKQERSTEKLTPLFSISNRHQPQSCGAEKRHTRMKKEKVPVNNLQANYILKNRFFKSSKPSKNNKPQRSLKVYIAVYFLQ